MRAGGNSHGLTLLILKDQRGPVRQLYLSRPVMIYVPMAAILSISSLIISLHLKASDQIAGLEHQLVQQQFAMEAIVSDKNEALSRLQSQVNLLSKESSNFQAQLGTVSQLQQQLETFLNANHLSETASTDTSAPVSSSTKLSSLTWKPSRQIGGELIAVHDLRTGLDSYNALGTADIPHTEALIQDTEDDFKAMNMLLNEMKKQIPLQIQNAQSRINALSGTPSYWPTSSHRLTSSFGYRTDPFTGKAAFHAGIDIGGEVGDPVLAAAAGTVTTVEHDGSRGNFIIIKHPDGLETWYMHLSSSVVQVGDSILKGQKIGVLGNTGRSTGPHLHFQVMKKQHPVDPLPYIRTKRG